MFVSTYFQRAPDDFNDKCIILYTQGCNLRCPYCFNPDLVLKEKAGFYLSESSIEKMLHVKRKEFDYVVITGGDPAVYGMKLKPIMKTIKDLGYYLELCTNGTLDVSIYKNLCDLIRIDYKCVKAKYRQLGYDEDGFVHMEQTICDLANWEQNCGKPKLEVRTTLHQDLITQKELILIANRVKALGVMRYGIIYYDNSYSTIGKLSAFDEKAYNFDFLKDMFKEFKIYKARTESLIITEKRKDIIES